MEGAKKDAGLEFPEAGQEEVKSNEMSMTFGGDSGFFKMDKKMMDKTQNTRNHSPQKKRELDVIYETEHQVEEQKHKNDKKTLNPNFKEDMLLSFYEWPKMDGSSKPSNCITSRYDKKKNTMSDKELFRLNDDNSTPSCNLRLEPFQLQSMKNFSNGAEKTIH